MSKAPAEVIYESYALKSSFFYEKLRELGYFDLHKKLTDIVADQGESYTWDLRGEWGISDDAWDVILNSTINPLLIFAHPKLLKTHPRFLRYYRSVSMIPIKGFKTITQYSSPERAEENGGSIPDNKLLNVVTTINRICSFVLEMSDNISEDQIKHMMSATAGTHIDGSWRNKIGYEGERVVRSILIRSLHENKELSAFIDKNGTSTLISDSTPTSYLLENIKHIKSANLTNNNTIFFSSEPDIELLDTNGRTLGAIEVKAGLDPAGALERLGAMFKSFDHILAKEPNAINILVASCITEEVATRLSEANSVSITYILTDLIKNRNNAADRFTNRIRALLELIPNNRM